MARPADTLRLHVRGHVASCFSGTATTLVHANETVVKERSRTLDEGRTVVGQSGTTIRTGVVGPGTAAAAHPQLTNPDEGSLARLISLG
jgi:hypothetical protein